MSTMTPQQYQQALASLSQLTKLGNLSGTSTGLGAAGNVAGIFNGINSGTVGGGLNAGSSALRLGSTNWGQNGSALSHLGVGTDTAKSLNNGATGALDALQVYNGIRQGGFTGYGSALGAGMQGAGLALGNAGLSTAGGYIMAPLAVYNAVKNYKSGATGSDALQGASAGAAIGSVVPGVGTLIGAGVGALVGAGASAFGGGTDSQEATGAQHYTGAYDQYDANNQKQLAATLSPSDNIQYLQGLMNAHAAGNGGQSDLQAAFGKNNVSGLTTAMTDQINQALKSGTITADASPDQIYSQVVAPWLATKSGGATSGSDIKGNAVANPEQAALTNLIGQWQGGQLNNSSAVGVKGQTIGGLSTYGALGGLDNLSNTQLTADQMNKIKTGPALDPATNYTTLLQGPNATGAGALSTIAAANQAKSPQSQAALAAMRPNAVPAATTMTVPTTPAMSMQAQGYGFSEGGPMAKRKKSALDNLYKGSFKDRPQHFDDGGYVDYYDGGGDGGGGGAGGDSGPAETLDYFHPTNGGDYTQDAYGNYSNTDDYLKVPNASGKINSDGSPQAGSSWSKALEALKGNATGANGPQGLINLLKGVLPIAGAFMGHNNTNTKAPSPFPGMTQGATAPKAPTFNRTPVASPSNAPGGAPMTQQDWYTYGSRPEASFFNNNGVNLAQATGVAPGQAHGGQPKGASPLDSLGPDGVENEFDSSMASHVQGAGDGTSDDIPAKLSDGEYVMDANTVSMLGNGSNKAGAERLDQLRENLRKHAAKPMAKGKQFMKAKPPAAYMKGVK